MFLKNTAGQFIHFQGVDSSTGGIKSGVTWTIRRCIDGTFAAGGGTVTEDGTTGWYKYAMAQADTNGNDIGFNFTGTGAVPQTVNIVTTAANPTDGVRFGLTALPNAAAEAAGGLYTRGTGAGQIAQDANGNIRANLDTIKTQTVTCAAGVTVLASVGTAATDTAQTGDAYALTNSRLPAALTANGNMKSSLVEILTTALTETAGQIAAAFKQFFDVATPTGTMKAITSVGSVTGAVGSVTGNVGGNVIGSVGSLGANALDSTALHSNACAKIADSGIQRGASYWENNLDNRSLGWAVSKLVNKVDLNAAGDTLSIRKSNDTTALFTQTITTSGGAAPITVLDTV